MINNTKDPVNSMYLDDEDDIPEEQDYGNVYPEFWTPTCDSSPQSMESGSNQLIEYSTRGPNDVVLSGPVVGGWGPGRYHRSRRVAYHVLRDKFGADRVTPTRQVKGRWSFLIKNLKAGGSDA